MALFHSNPHDVPLQVDTRHIRYSDKTDFNSGECFFTYANVPNRAVAFEIAKWFCPKDYTVVYNYESKVVDVRGDGGNPQRATEADRRFITFFRADGSTARPAGRFIRLTKISSTPEQLRITQFQVFDYAGNIIKPIQVTISPQPNPVMASYLVDDNIDPAKELVAETAPEKEVYMQLDFGSEIEIAGVRIYNALREAGTSIIGASLQVLTKSGIVVFGVPIRDNRSIYNIRTSPLQMLTRRDYGRYNEIYIFVPGKCISPSRITMNPLNHEACRVDPKALRARHVHQGVHRYCYCRG